MTAHTCAQCERPLRGKHETATDRPGTRKIRARGLCESCYMAAWRDGSLPAARTPRRTETVAPEPFIPPAETEQYRGPDWRDRAACAGTDTEAFFPSVGARRAAYTTALSICASCPVRVACLADAMAIEAGTSELYRSGIFGGLTHQQRAAIGTQRVRA